MSKITVWDVQTFYGTRQKTFQRQHHAEAYARVLGREYDPDLVEVSRREVTEEEFCYEDIDD